MCMWHHGIYGHDAIAIFIYSMSVAQPTGVHNASISDWAASRCHDNQTEETRSVQIGMHTFKRLTV